MGGPDLLGYFDDHRFILTITRQQHWWTGVNHKPNFYKDALLTWRGRRYAKDFFHHCPSLTACSTALVVVVVLDKTFMVVAVVQCNRSAELLSEALPSSCVEKRKGNVKCSLVRRSTASDCWQQSDSLTPRETHLKSTLVGNDTNVKEEMPIVHHSPLSCLQKKTERTSVCWVNTHFQKTYQEEMHFVLPIQWPHILSGF